MSISSTLSIALSGLNATARAAEVVSSNVSNALTDGYGKRELELTSRSLAGRGSGVQVTGLSRHVDQQSIGDRRLADARLGNDSARTDFLSEMLTALGEPDDPASLTGRLAHLESALIEAASRPDSEPRLRAVLDRADDVAGGLNSASEKLQDLRMRADREISAQVESLNHGLQRIAELNNEIQARLGAGYDATALMDLRQREIDGIASIVPLREVQRDRGQVALFTPGGAILVEHNAAEIGFVAAGMIVLEMSQGSGALSGLTLNGRPIATGPGGSLAGGSLEGLFAVRDDLAVSAQASLDALARDLIERFEAPSADPTLSPGNPGLFTDGGTAFNALDEVALSARIAINPVANPDQGGALWRLRDGLGATVPGDSGNSTRLNALASALTNGRTPNSGGFLAAPRSAVGLAGDVLSILNGDLRSSEAQQTQSRARVETLRSTELQAGVDTDQEMQNLLLIEQAYAANARVISAADEMIQTLLGL